MRCLRIAMLALFSAMVVLAFGGSAFAAPSGWKVTQLTNSPYDQTSAVVSGSRVVWKDGAPGSPLWTWTPSETSHMISGDAAAISLPALDGDRAVWLGYSIANGYSERTWTPGTGETTVAALTGYTDTLNNAPKVSGTRVAWVDTPAGDTVSHVYTRDMSGSAVTTVSDNVYSIYEGIALSGDRIVWNCTTDGHSPNIFTRVVGDGGQLQLTHYLGVYEAAYSPDVSGDRVVWVDDPGTMLVRTWKSDGTSETLGPLANDGYMDPHVSGDRIVWRTPDANLVGQVTTWKTGDAQPLVLTAGGTTNTYHRFQQVSGDRVVWLERDISSLCVMTWKAGDSQPTTLSTDSVAQDPQVSGDRVVWRAVVDGRWQIFTAVLGEEPTPIATSLTKPSVSPSKPTHGKYATFTTYLRPGGGGVGAKVTLKLSQQLTRSVRHKVRGKWRTTKVKYWKLRKTITINGTGAEKFSTKVKLAYKGSWKAEASAAVGAGYTAPAPPPVRTFTVK